jgi:hypothetical protein
MLLEGEDEHEDVEFTIEELTAAKLKTIPNAAPTTDLE